MWRTFASVTFAALIVASGAVHGLWTERWRPAPEVAECVARLENIPKTVGDWHGEDLELSDRDVRAARLAGYCFRNYVNARNRHAVRVLLVCGRPGPISVHTPDVCFEGAGLKATAPPAAFQLAYGDADKKASFRTMRMRKSDTAFAGELRVFWTWGVGGNWRAPENPRLTFARTRSLYKLYVLRDKTDEEVRPEEDPCAQLMRLLLPELDAALFGAP